MGRSEGEGSSDVREKGVMVEGRTDGTVGVMEEGEI